MGTAKLMLELQKLHSETCMRSVHMHLWATAPFMTPNLYDDHDREFRVRPKWPNDGRTVSLHQIYTSKLWMTKWLLCEATKMKHADQPRWLNDKLMWVRESVTVTLVELVSSTSIQKVLGGTSQEIPWIPLMQNGEFNST